MNIIWIFIALLLLSIISYQDFKDRSVSWILFPLLAIDLMVYTYTRLSFFSVSNYFIQVFITSGFISLQVLLIILYYFVKTKSLSSIVNEKLGLGDVFFFYCMAFYFSFMNFMVFYTISLVLSVVLIVSGRLLGINGPFKKTIPLAGLQSLFLFGFMLSNLNFQFNPMNDQWLLTFIHLS